MPFLIQIIYSVNRSDLVKLLMISNNEFWSSVTSTFNLTVRHTGSYVPYGNYFCCGACYICGSNNKHMFYSLGLRYPKIEHVLSSSNLNTIPTLLLKCKYVIFRFQLKYHAGQKREHHNGPNFDNFRYFTALDTNEGASITPFLWLVHKSQKQ